MKLSTSRFAGLVLFAALLVGAPLLSANKGGNRGDEEKNESKKVRLQERLCEKQPTNSNCITAPDSHGGPLLALTAGVLGTAIFLHRRRKITS